MSEAVIERAVTLKASSWQLLDQAAEVDGELGPSELLDSLVQAFLRTDDGSAVDRASALGAIRRLFGDNQG